MRYLDGLKNVGFPVNNYVQTQVLRSIGLNLGQNMKNLIFIGYIFKKLGLRLKNYVLGPNKSDSPSKTTYIFKF